MTIEIGVPEHARPEWDALHERITATSPTPCAGPLRDRWTGSPREQTWAAEQCLSCEAFAACQAYAAAADERLGVWAGTTAAERTRARKEGKR